MKDPITERPELRRALSQPMAVMLAGRTGQDHLDTWPVCSLTRSRPQA
jgi:hypothetical protein